MIFIKTSAMQPLKREIISEKDYPTLLDFLKDEYPNGFEMPTDIHTQFNKIELDDYDMKLEENAIIVLIERPAVAAALGITSVFWALVVNTAVMLAVNYAISKLFAPDAPETPKSASAVYSLNSSQNAARLGDAIPVGYGTFRMYPSYVEFPYYKYEDNDEYLYLMLAVGMGRYTLDKLMIDNLDVSLSNDVQYQMIYQENFGNILDFLFPIAPKYNMRNNTLSNPSGLEVKDALSEEYEIKDTASQLELDFQFPRGLYQVDDTGKYI